MAKRVIENNLNSDFDLSDTSLCEVFKSKNNVSLPTGLSEKETDLGNAETENDHSLDKSNDFGSELMSGSHLVRDQQY